MNYMIVTPMARGQITVPKKYRDKYGIRPGEPVKIWDERGELVIRPIVTERVVTRSKYSNEEYSKLLNKMEKETREHGSFWTNKDDKWMEMLRIKDQERAKKLKW